MAAAPWYCTRETVKAALESASTARSNGQVDRAISAACRSVDEQMRRVFYPTVDTRRFTWPADNTVTGNRLWLEDSEVISVTSVSIDDVAVSTDDYTLEPVNEGPPYSRIELDLTGTTTSWSEGDIAVVGLFGFRDDEDDDSVTITGDITASARTVALSAAPDVGVGSLLRVGSERMIVRRRSMASTGQTLQTALTATSSERTVAVVDGGEFVEGDVLLVDAERMLVTDIAGNNLVVRRSWDGSALAAHTLGATVWALRSCTVDRGVLGTTAAAHTSGDTVYRARFPGLIEQLAVAEAMVLLLQEQSGYGRVVGQGETQREQAGDGLADLRNRAYAAYARKVV
ncbi:hypothetical protein [Actinokineospora sp. UTMC 2448]|uniref:hypothetical protein n=1 Tax=Actinokineospora sp. UTMC 2448 TaxID=2268449 RepID=UPI0021645280|nr:hypothetical protein [Actinokineospora sp. UTMC 2448]UVS81842.1 hypothetical protein Actkin_05606 [Actinokineospora sp. UTMC 2448]